jgi:hypothetical protein
MFDEPLEGSEDVDFLDKIFELIGENPLEK